MFELYMCHNIYRDLQSPMSEVSSLVKNTSLSPTLVNSLSKLNAPIEEREDFEDIGSLPAADDTKQVAENMTI